MMQPGMRPRNENRARLAVIATGDAKVPVDQTADVDQGDDHATPALPCPSSATLVPPDSSLPSTIDPRIVMVCQAVQERLGAQRFALWFEGKVRARIVDEQLHFSVGSPFLQTCMQKQFRQVLTTVAQDLLGPSATAVLTVDATLALRRDASGRVRTGSEVSTASVPGTAGFTITEPTASGWLLTSTWPPGGADATSATSSSSSLNAAPAILGRSEGVLFENPSVADHSVGENDADGTTQYGGRGDGQGSLTGSAVRDGSAVCSEGARSMVAETVAGPSSPATALAHRPAGRSRATGVHSKPSGSSPSASAAAKPVSPGSGVLGAPTATRVSSAISGATVSPSGLSGGPSAAGRNATGRGSSATGAATGSGLTARQRRLADLNEFIPTPVNEFAVAASRQVASLPGTQANPLFLHGPVGTGKTHLLEGVCRQLKRTHHGIQTVVLTAEGFTNYFTQALRDRTLPSFRQKFRGVDALLVDDVDFFEGKRSFQEEFLHTIADLIDHGRQVVVTGDRHPRLLTKLSEELISRLQSGLVCRLELPDRETRRAIVAAKAHRLDGEFAAEALDHIADRFAGSVRELEGALNCLQAYAAMTGERVTGAMARQVLADLERDCLRIVRLADVERVVCQLFGLKAKDLKSDSRVRTLAQPRMLAMFLARKHTPSAYSEIGEHFGGRNHSTVMAAERKVQKWLEENATVRIAAQPWTIHEIVQTLEQQLLAG